MTGAGGLVSSRVEYFEAPAARHDEVHSKKNSSNSCSSSSRKTTSKPTSPHQPQQRKSSSGDKSSSRNQKLDNAPPIPVEDSRVDDDANEDFLRHEDVREISMKPCEEPEVSHVGRSSGSSSSRKGNNPPPPPPPHFPQADESNNNAGNVSDATPHRRGGGGATGASPSSVSSKKKKKKSKQQQLPPPSVLPSTLPPPAQTQQAQAQVQAQVQHAQQQQQPNNSKQAEPVPGFGFELTEKGLEHYQKGEFAHAQKAFSTVLKTQSLADCFDGNVQDISVATTLGNLGAVFLKQERLLEAERALAESLAMKRRLAEAVPVVLADTLNNLGNCANLRGDYDESLQYYHQALNELRGGGGGASGNGGGSGENHHHNKNPPKRAAQVANLLFNIGRLEIQRREWDNALDALSEAWRMTRDVWGNSHVYVAQTLDLLGFVQISTKQYDSAIISFTGALSIYRRINGPLHPDVASALFNVGMVREARGDVDDALEAYKTARDLHIRLATPDDDAGFTTVRHSIASMQKSVTQKKLAHLVAKHQGTLLKKKQASGLI